MPSSNKTYVVLRGRVPGIYASWPEAQKQIHRYKGALFKGFESYEEAHIYWESGGIVSSRTEDRVVIHEGDTVRQFPLTEQLRACLHAQGLMP